MSVVRLREAVVGWGDGGSKGARGRAHLRKGESLREDMGNQECRGARAFGAVDEKARSARAE